MQIGRRRIWHAAAKRQNLRTIAPVRPGSKDTRRCVDSHGTVQMSLDLSVTVPNVHCVELGEFKLFEFHRGRAEMHARVEFGNTPAAPPKVLEDPYSEACIASAFLTARPLMVWRRGYACNGFPKTGYTGH